MAEINNKKEKSVKMEDIKHGRVYHADSVDDMMKQIFG